MSTSLWGHLTNTTTENDADLLGVYESDGDGFDVRGILAAAKNNVPFIDSSQLEYDRYLGAGTSFDVTLEMYTPRYPDSPYFVAVKRMKLTGKSPIQKRQISRCVMREIRVLMHPAIRNNGYIIPLLAFGWENSAREGAIPYLVTDWSDHGTLDKWLARVQYSPLEKQQFAQDIAIGLASLHENGILHGDVKASNVLVFSMTNLKRSLRRQCAKLSDFGSAIFESDLAVSRVTYRGTPIYNAPEVQRNDSGVGKTFLSCTKAEVYSFGLLLWETIADGKSYRSVTAASDGISTLIEATEQNQEMSSQMRSLLEFLPRLGLTVRVDAVVKMALSACLKEDPALRSSMPSVVEILSSGAGDSKVENSYPLDTNGRLSVNLFKIRAPHGYYLRSEEPEIAIPSPMFMKPGQKPYIMRYDHQTSSWTTTEEEDPPRTGNLCTLPARPATINQSTKQFQIDDQPSQRNVDIFTMAPETSPPWSVQCSIFRSLKEDALREADLTLRDHAHLQLAACCHLGVGCRPDSQETIWRLQQIDHAQVTAVNLWPRVVEALLVLDLAGRPVLFCGEQIDKQQKPSDSNERHHELFAKCLRLASTQAKTKGLVFRTQPISREALINLIGESVDGDEAAEVLELHRHDGSVEKVSVLRYFASLADPGPLKVLLQHPIEECKDANRSSLNLENFWIGPEDLTSGEEVQGEIAKAVKHAFHAGTPEQAWLLIKKFPEIAVSLATYERPSMLHWVVAMPSKDLSRLVSVLLMPEDDTFSKARMRLFEEYSPDVLQVAEMNADLFGTPLHWAVRCGNLELVKILLDAGADIDARWRKTTLRTNGLISRYALSYSALDVATQWHYSEIVQLLLERGAKVYGGILRDNFPEEHHAISLIGTTVKLFGRHAVHGRNILRAMEETIKIFADHGHSLYCQNSNGESALSVAFSQSDQEDYILEVLMRHTDKTNWVWLENLLPSICQQGSIRRYSTRRVQLAINVINDPNLLDEASGNNSLHFAALGSNEDVAEQLLTHTQIRPDEVNRHGLTALMLAAQSGAIRVAELLIKSGANIEQHDMTCRPALCHAIESRQTEMAIFLVRCGAITSWSISPGKYEVDMQQETALTLASIGHDREFSMLQDLLEACEKLRTAEVLDHQGKDGWTALHEAVWYGDFQGVSALLRFGASTFIVTRKFLHDDTALRLAERRFDDVHRLGDGHYDISSISWLREGRRSQWEAFRANMSKIRACLS